MIKNLIKKIVYQHKYSSDSYIKFLLRHNFTIGSGTYFFDPKTTKMDINRGSYIQIGENCKITSGTTIMAHDYSWINLIEYNKVICPSGGKNVIIGDNVFIGMNTTILGNVTIGDNVIIGAGSIVVNDLPGNTVCAGNPARVICTLDEYYKKLEKELLDNAVNEAKKFIKNYDRFPSIEECGYFMILFLERNKENFEKYLKNVSFKGLNKENNSIMTSFMSSSPKFNGYEEYIKYLKTKINI